MAHDRRYAYGYGPNGPPEREARWQEERRRMAEEARAAREAETMPLSEPWPRKESDG